ncbi:MAG: helix-turn-helix domain-containing protein [Thermoleophilia bacterium]
MDTPSPTTITVAEAAISLGVSERTVWRYLKSGRLPSETVGEPGEKRTLIPRAAVDALHAGRGGDADALRVERDRLAAALAAAQAERDALTSRVVVLQRALSRPPGPSLAERALGRALVLIGSRRAAA